MIGRPTGTTAKPMSRVEVSHLDRSTRRIVWLMAGAMLLSFTFGVAMFAPAEHRAYKLQEMQYKYRERGRQASIKLGVDPAQSAAEVPPEQR